MRDKDQNIVVLVHRPQKYSDREITALPAERDVDLIHMPGIARPDMPPAQVPSKGATEFATPPSDTLLRDCDSAVGEKVFDIAEAEGVPMIEPYSVTQDLGCEAATSIRGLDRSSVRRARNLNNTPRLLSYKESDGKDPFSQDPALFRIIRDHQISG